MSAPQEIHFPVMLNETLEALDLAAGGLFVDATLGMGGHTEAILQAAPNSQVIGLDRDGEALKIAKGRLSKFGDRFRAVQSDYRQIKNVLLENGIAEVRGVLADLGISSYQLDTPDRGFSFRFSENSPLDMRMDRTEKTTAADLVKSLGERELADLIFEYGEEHASRKIAHRIVQTRAESPITTTKQLADLVIGAVHQKGHWKIHPATKTFQALRIAVNRELEGLKEFIADTVDIIGTDGRLVIITFHSLEDRIIKQALKYQSGYCICPPQLPDCRCGVRRRIELLSSKPIKPSATEVITNARSRSAKLRASKKL